MVIWLLRCVQGITIFLSCNSPLLFEIRLFCVVWKTLRFLVLNSCFVFSTNSFSCPSIYSFELSRILVVTQCSVWWCTMSLCVCARASINSFIFISFRYMVLNIARYWDRHNCQLPSWYFSLFLQNNMIQSLPIRVIRGNDCPNSITKRLYTYDGLYKVSHSNTKCFLFSLFNFISCS